MKKHTIIGMAGHIDHGKTALIKALTGIQTDQHKEEQERGITIDIGFAYWKDNITIIDVPGHEKFVKNMVAGVNTVDLFLLVIAADDGIMPQTVEHLEILKFFGVKDGIVVLNKTDLVDQDWLMLVEDEIEQFLSKHGYNDIPIIPVSAVKNTSIETLRETITEKIDNLQRTFNDRPFRLNVDRSFSAKGFGSVVTGTILSSEIHTGDILSVLPSLKMTKIRGLQVNQRETDTGFCGQRCAINLSGIGKEELPRGTVLVKEKTLFPTNTILAKIKTTDHIKIKLKRYSQIRFHIGRQEIHGKLYWFDKSQQLMEDGNYHVYISSAEPFITAPGDPILIRTTSPVDTIAGGKVVMIDAPGVKRIMRSWQEIFKIWASDDLIMKIKSLFDLSGYNTITMQQIATQLFENDKVCSDALNTLLKQKFLVDFDFKNERHFISNSKMDQAIEDIVESLESEITKNQLSAGYNLQHIKNMLKKFHISEPFLERTLQKAVASGKLVLSGTEYSTENQAKNDKRSQASQEILDIYKKQAFNVPDLTNLINSTGLDLKTVKNITLALAKEGQLISISGQFYLHHNVFQNLIDFLKTHFKKHKTIDVGGLREFTKVSRKFLIPLLEYLDNNDWTIREGDVRKPGLKLE